MRDEWPTSDWLTSVLARGGRAVDEVPWRPGGRAERVAVERELRDGLLQRVVADVVLPADVPLDTSLRARALELLVPDGLVVLADAAAWVHLGPPVPAPHVVHLAGGRLPELPATPMPLSFSRVRPGPDEVQVIAGLAVTTPARTLLDVAAATPHRAQWLRERMVAASMLAEQDVREASDRARGRGGVRTARRALQLPRAPGPRAGVSSSSAATP